MRGRRCIFGLFVVVASASVLALAGAATAVNGLGHGFLAKGRAGSATAVATLPTNFQESIVFSGLTLPTALRFASDGRIFVAEKSGLIKIFDNLADTTPTVFADLRTAVDDYWDRGLLGLALDPNFPASPYVYALYAYDAPPGQTAPVWNDACPSPPGPTTDGCVVTGRLARLTASGNTMSAQQILLSGWCQQFPSHSIGDLRFGADGALYVSGGDGASFNNVDYGQYGGSAGSPTPKNPCGDPPAGVGGTESPPTAEGGSLRSQSLHRVAGPALLNGAILRVDPATGNALPDNPLAASSDATARRIVAEGTRNPFRFTIRPGTNELWVGDVGWNAWEEINRKVSPTASVQNFGNFGWPCYEGAGAQPGYQSANLNICTGLYSTGTAVGPYYTYNHSASVVSGDGCPTGSSSITGLAFYTGGTYPTAYSGALFFADHSRNCIWAMMPGGDGLPNAGNRIGFVTPAAGPVDLEIGPGGDLFYVGFDDGTVRRIQYLGANQPPAASATASPTSGTAPLTVAFNGSASSDPDPGDTITYSWDLNGDGGYGDSTAVTPTFTYTNPGTYNVTLRVTDNHGASSTSTPITISASNTAPAPVIDNPAGTFTWKVGDTINFSGHATDQQDGTEPSSRLTWTVILHHCPSNCHTHLLQTFTGVASGSFAAPDHEYPSYLELQLAATDAQGASTSASIQLDPQTVDLTFASNPTGLQLSVGTFTGGASFTRTVIIGSTNSLTAPNQSLGGTSYVFSSWSDGGAQTHTITAPSAPATYTATFNAVNSPPIAVATANPTTGAIPLTFFFDGSRSSDPDGDPLVYSWDLNGDGVFGESTAATPIFTYTKPGRINVRLRVTDSKGASATASLAIQPKKK
jgi:PKD repeat protein/glucose/arabinose dehydrogenase